ncbi:MAG: hypothetical protein HKM93_21020 [Desulfobacteraceae bacterium]|nr:hypothetical protein [Desulfobacteraceae bacterium]
MVEPTSKLIPILREGVNIVKMILFKEMKSYLSDRYADTNAGYVAKLTGAIINEVFGTPNTNESFTAFNRDNKERIESEMAGIPDNFGKFLTLATDALRIQFLCDSLEGLDSEPALVRAKKLGILMMEREIPLPKTFMETVRKLGVAYKILQPMNIHEDLSTSVH